MTAYLAPQFDTQFFDGSTVAAGYKLYTYESGTTTPKAVYSDQAGTVPHTNPIVLDANGRVAGQMFLGSGEYTFTLKTSADVLVKTWNDVAGASTTVDDALIRSDLASTSDAAKGAGMVGYNKSLQHERGTVGSKLREKISVSEYAELVFTATAKSPGDAASHTAISFSSWRLAIQAALDEAESRPGGAEVVIDGGQAPYAQSVLLIDDYIRIGDNTDVTFLAEVKLADYTTIGCMLVPDGDNITINGVKLDGSGIYAGGSGQNGIAPTGTISNLKVFGGKIRNCARGNAGPKDGGKAFQFESAHSGVVVDGTTVESSFTGISTKHDFGSIASAGPLIFSNIVAKSCEILMIVRQSNGRSTTGRDHSVILQNFQAQECGTFQGLIQLSRASGVLVANGVITNSTSIDSIIRGNHAFCEFKGLQYFGDATALINLDPSDYAIDSSYVNENNTYELKHQSGIAGYIANASLATTNRTLQDCQIRAHLQNDVTTKIVGDEIRNAYCLLDVQHGGRHIIATSSTLYLEGRTNFASFPTGLSAPRQNVSQLSFPSSQISSANPNTLDDYEENLESSPIVLTDSSGAGLSFTAQYADYTKIGRMVFVSFRVTYPVTASGSSSSISGLPVAAANNSSRVCCGLSLRYTDIGSGVTGIINPGGVAFGFSSLSGTALTNADLSGKTVDGLLTYMAAT